MFNLDIKMLYRVWLVDVLTWPNRYRNSSKMVKGSLTHVSRRNTSFLKILTKNVEIFYDFKNSSKILAKYSPSLSHIFWCNFHFCFYWCMFHTLAPSCTLRKKFKPKKPYFFTTNYRFCPVFHKIFFENLLENDFLDCVLV